MKIHRNLIVTLIFILILQFSAAPVVAQDSSPDDPLAALGTAFTYQGYLDNNGSPANAVCDLRFGLWDALTGGAQIGSLSTSLNVQVSKGLFTTTVNAGGEFSTSAFTGSARWLAIEARCPAGSGSYTLLSPRQAITLVPYAAHADSLDGQHGSYYRSATNINAGTLGTGYYSAYNDLSAEGYLGNAAGDLALNNGTLQSTLNADRLDGAHGSSYMVGRPVFSLTTLDSAGASGVDTSITIGADGLGLISYHDNIDSDLKVAHCNDTACTSATITTLDSSGVVGFTSSITIGADGLGLISYGDGTNHDLKVAHCANTACSTASTYNLSVGGTASSTSITIGTDGLGLISFMNETDFQLHVAHCSNTACSSATAVIVDSGVDTGYDSSITIGTDGYGLISYYDAPNGDLKVAHCTNIDCSSHVLYILDSTGDVGSYTSIAIGNDGMGLISYYDKTNGNLKVAHCSNTNCTSSTNTTVDNSTFDVGYATSISIGSDELGLISYYDYTNGDLRVAHCTYITCSAATVNTVDSTDDVGYYTSITLGVDELALISYWDVTNNDLKVAHCSNRYCMPYVRTR